MKTPFTTEQFFEVIRNYNISVWPMQILLNLIAIGGIILLFLNIKYKSRFVFWILAFLWIWMGLVYHLIFFTRINPAAYLFGSLFILQSLLFAYDGFFHSSRQSPQSVDIYNITGALFILFALLIYPVLGAHFSHKYPDSPTFGLPCPTTIFTFGILLLMKTRVRVWFLIIPVIWSVIGFTAALKFGVYEDTGLLVAGIGGFVMILLRNRQMKN